MITKYQEFILEKKENELLELITEAVFILSNKLTDIIDDLAESNDVFISRIAKMFQNLDMTDIDTNMSYFDITDDNGYISFLNPEKAEKIRSEKGYTPSELFNNSDSIKGNPVKLGRLVRRISDVFKKNKGYEKGTPSYDRFTFTDAEIEKFVNAFKSTYDYYQTGTGNFELISGNKILFAYDEHNYYNDKGTLGGSCMRYSECQDYIGFYANNDNVELLVMWGPNEKVIGRALVWKLTSGEKFMDRVYYSKDSDLGLFTKYAEENKFIYKKRQNSIDYESILTPNDNYIDGSEMKLEVDVYKVELSDKDEETFPYMDTLKYYYWDTGKLRNWRDTSLGYYVILEDTDGGSKCTKCNDGYSDCQRCDGRGEEECESCDGYGHINCSNCDGEGSIGCQNCDGKGMIEGVDGGETECPDCDSDGYLDCKECGTSGHEDCEDCNGHGSSECTKCHGNCEEKCDKCGGMSRY